MKLAEATVVSLAKLSLGQTAKIVSFTDDELSLKLLEMGCLPNTVITVVNVAPLGCPVCVSVSHKNQLALRKTEAATILVEILPQQEVAALSE